MQIPRNTYPATEKCATCAGNCCKRKPGEWWPEDFSPLTAEAIAATLGNSNSVDWWEGDPDENGSLPRTYYIRPATIATPRAIADPSWAGQCIHLGVSGCALSFEKRPMGCRRMDSSTCDKHVGLGSKEEAAWMWRPYQDIVEAAIRLAEEATE